MNKVLFSEEEVFHLGNDGIIHFTETHKNKRYEDFCIDIGAEVEENDDHGNKNTFYGPIGESDGNDYYELEEDSSFKDEHSYNYQEYNDTLDDEYYPDDNGGSNGSTCNVYPDERRHTMVAMFCDYAFVTLPKCCDKYPNDEYLNLRYIFTDDE